MHHFIAILIKHTRTRTRSQAKEYKKVNCTLWLVIQIEYTLSLPHANMQMNLLTIEYSSMECNKKSGHLNSIIAIKINFIWVELIKIQRLKNSILFVCACTQRAQQIMILEREKYREKNGQFIFMFVLFGIADINQTFLLVTQFRFFDSPAIYSIAFFFAFFLSFSAWIGKFFGTGVFKIQRKSNCFKCKNTLPRAMYVLLRVCDIICCFFFFCI